MKTAIGGNVRSPFHFANMGALARAKRRDLVVRVVGVQQARTRHNSTLLYGSRMGCFSLEVAWGNRRVPLPIEGIGTVLINRVLSSQELACMRRVCRNPLTVNIDGGGLSNGRQSGAIGARSPVNGTVLLKCEKSRYLLAAQCLGRVQCLATLR